MAIADLKKNVKAPAAAPGTSLKEKAPNIPGRTASTAPRSLGLVPKDLALEPQEPSAPRRDITNPSTVSTTPAAPTTPAAATSATKPTAVAKPGSIALVPINQKQVFSALTAVAREQVAGGTATSTNSTATPSATPSAASSTGPSLAKAFTAGFKGDYMPQDSGTTTPQLDLSDPRSLVTLVRQMNKLVRSGEKLDPQTKQTLQQLITKL
jgi:hypothetical protein